MFACCLPQATDMRHVDFISCNGSAILSRTMKENDLGVTVNVDIIISEQCGIAVSNCIKL